MRLEVADDGAGFAPEERERRREEGHVGLSLLEELAVSAGGRLDVRSAPGEGTDLRAGAAARMIRLLIADDHAVVRTGLAQLVATFGEIELVGAAANGAEAVEHCLRSEPDVVLMDLEMPVLDGIAATRAIVAAQPAVAIVVLTSFSRSGPDPAGARRGGGRLPAEGRRAGGDREGGARRGQGRGAARPARGAGPAERASAASPVDGLSEREREVLQLVARGLPNKLIARELSISEKTVKAHLTQIFRTIGVTDRTQAALWAERNGLGS